MEHELLSVVDELSGARRIEQCRPLSREDFKITQSLRAPEDPQEDKYNLIHIKYILELKEEVIDHIVEVLGIKLGVGRDGRPQLPQRDQLGNLCHSWNPVPLRHWAGLDVKVDYRGISSKQVERRQKKYDAVRHQMLSDFEDNKDKYLDDKIAELNETIPKILREPNRRFDDALKGFIVQLNVKEEWFKETEPEEAKRIKGLIDASSAEIDRQKKIRTAYEKDYYRLRRNHLVDHIVNDGDFTVATTEEVKQMAQEANDDNPIPERKRRVWV